VKPYSALNVEQELRSVISQDGMELFIDWASLLKWGKQAEYFLNRKI
jgi:hypothetical protein